MAFGLVIDQTPYLLSQMHFGPVKLDAISGLPKVPEDMEWRIPRNGDLSCCAKDITEVDSVIAQK